MFVSRLVIQQKTLTFVSKDLVISTGFPDESIPITLPFLLSFNDIYSITSQELDFHYLTKKYTEGPIFQVDDVCMDKFATV